MAESAKTSSTFLQRSKSDTPVSDAYKGVKSAVSHYTDTAVDTAGSIANETANYFKKTSNSKSILQGIEFTPAGIDRAIGNAQNAATDILSKAGVDRDTINTLSNMASNGVGDVDSITGIADVVSKGTGYKIIGEAGKVYGTFSGTDLTSVYGVTKLASNLAGLGVGLENLGPYCELAQMACRMSVVLGLTDLAQGIIDKFKNEKSMQEYLINQLPEYALLGKLDMVNKVIDIIGSENARVRVPEAERYILGGYSIPKGTPHSKYPELGNKLYNTICRFANPFKKVLLCTNEDTDYYGYDLTMFSRATASSRIVLIAADKFVEELLIAKDYPKTKLYEGTLKLYNVA